MINNDIKMQRNNRCIQLLPGWQPLSNAGQNQVIELQDILSYIRDHLADGAAKAGVG